METLEVYLNGRKAGRLVDDNGKMSFAYIREYLETDGREPISFSIPLRAEAFAHDEIEAFLSNLLPDDIIRTRIADILQIPRENTFALLKAIGGDCAGAVSFLSEGTSPETSDKGEYRELSDKEAGRILDNLQKRPLDVGEEGFRISGAGAQDKLIACMKDGQVLLPLNGTPSTHIIKPAMPDYPDSVENEWFAMRLACACRLSVAACDIAVIDGKRCYVCERYDRESIDGKVRRLHQEDFCQMLKVDPKRKYESVGGPGLKESFALLRALQLPASDTVEFLNRILFNFIVGNGDAHAKNFSVLYRDGVPRLSPAYDVMSTAIYPEVGKRMAMKVDGEYAFKWITRSKFLRMADKLRIHPHIVNSAMDKMIRRVKLALPQLVAQATRRFPRRCYSAIADGIASRLSQLEA
ncbi:MAG: type II toxin-antitoxin system HipA family toxin [Kiritimatiellae bacterium]|nr:type II toxin-antitoxin system HipA family toxin [Kiritimatiellia bacterium]